MLKFIRTLIATTTCLLITLLFLDFTGVIAHGFKWLAKLQCLPALLSFNVLALLVIVGLTLLFGRLYCSILCPLGIVQDGISHLAGKFKPNRFHATKAKTVLRFSVLVVLILAALLGINALVALLAPYSAYGRIVSATLLPLYQSANNLLARVAEHYQSYCFYSVEIWLPSLTTAIIAWVSLVVIACLAIRSGRTYCNTLCPVGTLLGYLSKLAVFKIRIDTTKCINCKRCEKNCKSSCIDIATHTIDVTRCVECMDCLTLCPKQAIAYTAKKKAPAKTVQTPSSPDTNKVSRKAFLTTGALFLAGSLKAASEKTVDGGFAPITPKSVPPRQTALKPAGAQSLRNFAQHCTGCQLCVTHCPSHVLRPSQDLKHWMQPEMSYENGYCRPECTRCSELCPSGAILPVQKSEKASIQIGHAVWNPSLCIVKTEGVACKNCARHCPNAAIQMVPVAPNSKLFFPSIDTERCIGCGACENLCPVSPVSAITVVGHEAHRFI